ncbi:MAG: hypothetical protein QOF51_1215 [Chloroflexota bacterium]|jgi:hypothetical protein|nr:hypothetical protein [Chloroflexota bacterium]
MTLNIPATQQSPIRPGTQIQLTVDFQGGNFPVGFSDFKPIRFKLWGPESPACTGQDPLISEKPVNANGRYQSAPIVLTKPGTYRWTATYEGDANNQGASTVCNAPNSTITVEAGNPRFGVNSPALFSDSTRVPSSWTADVRDLGVGRVRFRIGGSPGFACGPSENLVRDLVPYLSVIHDADGYKFNGVEPLAILGGGILAIDINPSPPLQYRPGGDGVCAGTGNKYSVDFPARAREVANALFQEAGVTCFEIWNGQMLWKAQVAEIILSLLAITRCLPN